MVADMVAKWLAEKGISHAFGIVGGGNNALWNAITEFKKTQIVCNHHEQAATMAASYYARSTGRIGFALVTTGAGSSNAITGVLAAHMDGTPLLVISGNEASKHMGSPARVWGVQGYASIEVMHPIVKADRRLMTPGRAVAQLESLYEYALAAPRGPVWADLPKDIQNSEI